MRTISKKSKQLLKWVFVVAIVAAIVYTFRDLVEPIYEELKQTAAWVVVVICFAAVLYHLVEGWINYSFARVYNPDFTYGMGVESAFYCSFYRVATLGSGAGVAAVYYFNEKGIPASKGTGMYMVEYVVHKMTIALFSVIFFLINYGYMKEHFSEYFPLLAAGYVVTALIAAGLLLFCCSKKFHQLILWMLGKLNRKGKFDKQVESLKEQCHILEDATAELMTKASLIVSVVLKNLLKFAFCYAIPFIILYQEYGLTLLQSWAITSVSFMLAAVIPSPAGIGSSEFVFTAMFAAIVGTGEAGSAALLYRFATFVMPFLIGAVIVLLRKRVAKLSAKHHAKQVADRTVV